MNFLEQKSQEISNPTQKERENEKSILNLLQDTDFDQETIPQSATDEMQLQSTPSTVETKAVEAATTTAATSKETKVEYIILEDEEIIFDSW